MNTARQILRFSIPGSLFLLHAAVCYLLYRRLQGVPFVDASIPVQENLAAVLAVAATIPVGFVVYQIYYFSYGPILRLWPRPWGGRFVRRDRGGEILNTLAPRQIATLENVLGCKINREAPHALAPSGPSLHQRLMHWSHILEIAGTYKTLPMEGGTRQLKYESSWHTHWDSLRATLDIAGSYADCEQIKTEYTTLSDIYHSLGAAGIAVLSAWITVSLLSATHIGRIFESPAEALAGFALISTITAAVYLVFYVARGRTWRSAAASITFGLRWLFWRHGEDLRQ